MNDDADDVITSIVNSLRRTRAGGAEHRIIDLLLREYWAARMKLVNEGIGEIPIALRNYARERGWDGHGAF